MIYTEAGFRHKSGFKKIVLTQKLVSDINWDFNNILEDTARYAKPQLGLRLPGV